jgi:hypothetical protein
LFGVLAGNTVIGQTKRTMFQVVIVVPKLSSTQLLREANNFKWEVSWAADGGIESGRTIKGQTGWKDGRSEVGGDGSGPGYEGDDDSVDSQAEGGRIYVDVDTTNSGFASTPVYLLAVQQPIGIGLAVGTCVGYSPKPTSVRLWLTLGSEGRDRALAWAHQHGILNISATAGSGHVKAGWWLAQVLNEWGWSVSWIGRYAADAAVAKGGAAGETAALEHDRLANAKGVNEWKSAQSPLGSTVYQDVDITDRVINSGHHKGPNPFAELQGHEVGYVLGFTVDSSLWQMSGGAVMTRVSAKGFRVYLGKLSYHTRESSSHWSVVYAAFEIHGCRRIGLELTQYTFNPPGHLRTSLGLSAPVFTDLQNCLGEFHEVEGKMHNERRLFKKQLGEGSGQAALGGNRSSAKYIYLYYFTKGFWSVGDVNPASQTL